MQLPLNRLSIVQTIYADPDTGVVSTIKNKKKFLNSCVQSYWFFREITK